jgi:hypothetical protein
MAYTRPQMKLSVEIPTLNEAANVNAPLERLSHTPGIHEIVVANGGSRDGTPELVRSSAIWLVDSEPGRGIQLRAAAREAPGGRPALSAHRRLAAPAHGYADSARHGGGMRRR